MKEAFRLDLRSLAAARILAGLIVVYDILNRARFLTAHYTSDGVLPALTMFEKGKDVGFPTIYLVNDSWGVVAALFLVHALSGVCLTIGYQTRLATFLCWYLNTSLHHRNHLVNTGGDIFLKFLLLWCIFLPWGATWSVDKVLSRAPEAPNKLLAPGTIVLVLQMVLVYISSVANKWHPIWTEEGTALYYALSVDHLTTSHAIHLLRHPELMKYLSFSVMGAELIGGLALLLPFARVRLVVVVSFLLMHFSFGLFIHLGIFRWVPMVGLLALAPSMVWDKVRPSEMNPEIVKALRKLPVGHVATNYWSALKVRVFFVVAFGFGVLSCLQGVIDRPIMPQFVNRTGLALGINQHWPMFVYLDKVKDGWFVIEAELEDGTVLDLITGGEVSLDKPESVAATYDGVRWRRFMTNVIVPQGFPFLPDYSRFIRTTWNQNHPERRIKKLTLIFMKDAQELHYRFSPPEKKYLHIWESGPVEAAYLLPLTGRWSEIVGGIVR